VTDISALGAALDYLARGWHVAPIPPGKKYPVGLDRWQDIRADEDLLRQWWARWPDHGLGILTGTASGIFVVDVDVADGKNGDETLKDLQDAYSPLPDTVTTITGTGGQHLYFKLPDGVRIPNSAGKVLGPGLDVRGEGGQVVAPPTVHPNGQRYEHEHGHGPDDIQVADAPGWLLALLDKAADEEEAAARRHELARARADAATSDTPGAIWATTVTWADLLEPDGWTLHHIDGHGEQHWTRPGKQRREGTSATTGYKDSDVLKVFSTSCAPLEAEATYTKFGYLAATRFGGDHSAAARSLAAQGYRAPDTTVQDLLGVDPSGKTPTPGPIDRDAGDEWPDPKPIDQAPPVPEWPTGIFPTWIEDQIANVSRSVQCAPDFPATFALGALSAISLGHAEVVKRPGHVERLALYQVAIGGPGEGKSPAEELMMEPVYEHEARVIGLAAGEVARATTERTILEKQAKGAEDKAAKSRDPNDLMAAQDLRAKLAEAERPPTGELIVTDITPEKMATALAENGEVCAFISDEGGAMLSVDRYRASGRTANMDLYLKAWSGRKCVVKRQTGPSVSLRRPLITICIGAQPESWEKAMDDDEFRYRGLGARFMSVNPRPYVEQRVEDLERDVYDLDVADIYGERLTRLAARFHSWGHQYAAQLVLDVEARRYWSDWANDRRDLFLTGGRLDNELQWWSKLKDTVIRVAGLLHLADGLDSGTQVGRDVMARACRLGDHWIAHRAQEKNPARVAAERLRALLVRVAVAVGDCGAMTLRDIGRAGPKGLRTAADIAPMLPVLIDLGWVRLEGPAIGLAPDIGAALRSCTAIRVHPSLVQRPVNNVPDRGVETVSEGASEPEPTATDMTDGNGPNVVGDHSPSTSVGHVGGVGVIGDFTSSSSFSRSSGPPPEPDRHDRQAPSGPPVDDADGPPLLSLFATDDEDDADA